MLHEGHNTASDLQQIPGPTFPFLEKKSFKKAV